MQLIFKWANRNSIMDYKNPCHRKPTRDEIKKVLINKKHKTKDGLILFENSGLIEIQRIIGNNINSNRYCDFYETK